MKKFVIAGCYPPVSHDAHHVAWFERLTALFPSSDSFLITLVRCPAPPFSSLLRLVNEVDVSLSSSSLPTFTISFSALGTLVDGDDGSSFLTPEPEPEPEPEANPGVEAKLGAFESSPRPFSSSLGVISDLIPPAFTFVSSPLTFRSGLDGPPDFDGVACDIGFVFGFGLAGDVVCF